MSIGPEVPRTIISSPHRVLDNLLEGCQIYSRNWCCLYANETAARQAGRPRKALLGMPITEVFPGIESASVYAPLHRCMEEHEGTRMEAALPSKGGRLAWFELSCTPVTEGILVLTSDIGGRKGVEQSLKISEERFRSLVEQAADAMFVHDFEGRFVEVNQQACRSLGYTREELLSMRVTDLEQDFDLAAAQAQWSKVEKDKPFTLYGHQRRKDGSVFPVEIRFGRFDVGTEAFFLGMVRDVTEREAAQRRQQHLTDVLKAIRNVNQLIVHEKDPAMLLRRTCELLTEARGYETAWVVIREPDGSMRVAAESRVPDREKFLRMSAQIERGVLPACCSQALARPDVAIIHDISADCAGCALARTYEGTAALSMALRTAERDLGVIVVALPRSLAADAEERSLFREVTEDIAFALQTIETEQQ
ncbi:MAG TPA: PAS domain S-box protein, partial [Spirochaetia bacterium]|nr:PAS domain S-box protein [Spirochaetia bacterium]